jgi:hypothetical protein
MLILLDTNIDTKLFFFFFFQECSVFVTLFDVDDSFQSSWTSKHSIFMKLVVHVDVFG